MSKMNGKRHSSKFSAMNGKREKKITNNRTLTKNRICILIGSSKFRESPACAKEYSEILLL